MGLVNDDDQSLVRACGDRSTLRVPLVKSLGRIQSYCLGKTAAGLKQYKLR
jgi:hypothetical protein